MFEKIGVGVDRVGSWLVDDGCVLSVREGGLVYDYGNGL